VRTTVDAFVGGRIKQRRKALAMSQDSLSVAFGVTFQEIQNKSAVSTGLAPEQSTRWPTR
jgi:hypothetical protein